MPVAFGRVRRKSRIFADETDYTDFLVRGFSGEREGAGREV